MNIQATPNKRAKFIELAEKRVNKALKSIQVIGNLSNRTLYEYSEDDVRQVTRALEDELKTLKKRFESPKKEKDSGFRISAA